MSQARTDQCSTPLARARPNSRPRLWKLSAESSSNRQEPARRALFGSAEPSSDQIRSAAAGCWRLSACCDHRTRSCRIRQKHGGVARALRAAFRTVKPQSGHRCGDPKPRFCLNNQNLSGRRRRPRSLSAFDAGAIGTSAQSGALLSPQSMHS